MYHIGYLTLLRDTLFLWLFQKNQAYAKRYPLERLANTNELLVILSVAKRILASGINLLFKEILCIG